MNELSEQQKQGIISALSDAGAKAPCPRCGNKSFTLMDGYLNQPVQSELGGITIGGPSIPSVVVVCDRCGFMAQHALGSLGLMPQQPESGGGGQQEPSDQDGDNSEERSDG